MGRSALVDREPIILILPVSRLITVLDSLVAHAQHSLAQESPQADDPFAPIFLSVAELTERIKRIARERFLGSRPARRGLERGPPAVGASLLHAQG